MPNSYVTAKKLDYYDDEEIKKLIEEAEKIIASNNNTPRRNELNPAETNFRELRNIRNELDAFLAPSPQPPLDDLPQEADSSISIVSISNSSSSLVTNLSSSTSLIRNDDGVILVTDSPAPAPAPPIIDLCTPINGNRRRRRNFNNVDVIEIDDYQPIHKTKVTKQLPPESIKSSISPEINQNNGTNINNVMCPICLETTRQPKTTKCGHVFCSECIKNAIKTFKKCPICKRPCSEKQLISIFI